MSTAPSGFQTPKTNWQPVDVVQPSDLNRIEGNINAIEQGTRTLNQAQAPSGNAGNLRQILSWLANRIRAITGMTNWYDAPPTTLAAAKAHIDAIPAVAYGPGDTILAEALGSRSTRANYQDPATLRTFVSPLTGTYRITFEGWITDSSEFMWAGLYVNETRVVSRNTYSTSPVPFSWDVGPVYPGDIISLKVGQSGEGLSAPSAYIQNFRVRGVPAPPPFVIT